ncbi:MAG: hypothetical protein HKO59_01485 [Phycisphaerales bacterium]|nr:hypothetical protein [Phycisphaerae bacterium]NNF44417.1 hypothetical protein [Phycisphaerales bacterium]NNM24653.1 hypothetical protein [Phycisphaerales bacterium]
MSIVVAISKNDRIVIASDSLTSFSDDLCVPAANSATSKIRTLGDALLGASGWAVYDRILDDYLATAETPRLDDESAIFAFFLDLWKALHDRYPFVNDQAGSRETPFGDLDSTFLIAAPRGIYKVSNDMDVCRFRQYYAIGSGAPYAFGALHTLYETELPPDEIARRAVATANAFDPYCGGQIVVREVGR